MKTTFKIILALICLSAGASSGQNFKAEWEKQLSGPAIHSFSDVIQTKDSSFTVLGSISRKGSPEHDLWLLKFSKSGDTLQTIHYPGEGHDEPVRLLQMPDGGYLVAALSGNPATGLTSLVLRTSEEGRELWRIYSKEKILTSRTDIAVNPDNTWWWLNTYPEEGATSSVRLSRMGQNGEILEEYSYVEKQSQEAHAIRLLPDGTLAVSGQIDQGKGTSTLWVMRVNQQGTVIWRSIVPATGKKISPECICCTPDNHLMVAGWIGSSMNPDAAPEDQIYDYDLVMTKIDASGKIIWTKNYDREGSEGGNALAVRPDGNILVAGKCATSFTGTVGPWLIYIDPSGKLLKDQVDKFRFSGDQASRIINTLDGGFLMVGPGKTEGDTRRNAGWIKKFKP